MCIPIEIRKPAHVGRKLMIIAKTLITKSAYKNQIPPFGFETPRSEVLITCIESLLFA